jgi:PAS domain S-box-containing protein
VSAVPGAPVEAADQTSTAGSRRRQLEQALCYYRDLYDRAPVGYLLLDAQGVIEDINRTGAAMLDWPRERLIGGPFARWVVREDRDLLCRHLAELRGRCEGRLTQELRIKTRSGWRIHVRLDSARMDGEGAAAGACRCAMVDVSAHRFAERQARLLQSRMTHAARLSTIGALASSLAHDLNQPLGTIRLNCDAALRMVRAGGGDDGSLTEALSQAVGAAAYAGEITRHLKSFLRKDDAQLIAVELPGLIAGAMRLIEAEARDHEVRIEAQCAAALPPVLAEPVHIEQVLINLLSNSIEAMRSAECPVRRITIRAQPLPRRVLVSVADSGPGMDRQCAARAVQPFYTTKHNGLGMGLSISHAIVEAHGGKLWVEPGIGAGTVLHFTLPAIRDEE